MRRSSKPLPSQLSLQRLSVEGPLRGGAKLTAYRQADVFVLPTLNENFGITVAEALGAERPVIATKGAPWCGLEREGCGWWIDHGVESLAHALAQAMALNRETLHRMGAQGPCLDGTGLFLGSRRPRHPRPLPLARRGRRVAAHGAAWIACCPTHEPDDV